MNRLSKREYEAVWWAAQGLTARQIGLKLSISAQTVKSLWYQARLKVGAANIAHLVYLVMCSKPEGG